MNRRTMLWAGFVTVIFVVGIKLNIVSTLFTIFVIGIIPGTTTAIPAWAMLIVYPALIFGTIYWFSQQTLLIGDASTTPVKKPAAIKSPRVARIKKQAKVITTSKRRERVAT